MYVQLQWTHQCSHPFTPPPRSLGQFQLPRILPTLGIFHRLHFCHANEYVAISHLHFLWLTRLIPFCLCIKCTKEDILICSLVKCLFKCFVHFNVFFFLLACRSFIYILHTSLLSDWHIANSYFWLCPLWTTFFFFLSFCLFAISWATPVAYGGSQARAGIKPTALWFLVGFINHCATMGTPILFIFYFLATPTACGSSWARDQTHAIAATQTIAVTILDL